jgi:HEPN domain-containing protein
LPTPEEIEAADLFLEKAASDVAAARLLAADACQADDVVGFHAQQAVEKALKAVVAVRSLEIPRSHDIGLLLRLLDPDRSELPGEIREADWLNPWAVTMRYDEPSSEFDRARALRLAEKSLNWARGRVDAVRAGSGGESSLGDAEAP